MFLQMTHHFQIGAPPAISPECETGEELLRNLQLFQIELLKSIFPISKQQDNLLTHVRNDYMNFEEILIQMSLTLIFFENTLFKKIT